MSLLVQKYGGTSVGSIERIQAVARQIRDIKADGHDVVVVVSAMKGETNRLTALGNQVSINPVEREMDVLLASGEQVSIALLSMALVDLNVKACSMLAYQIPVNTDGKHTIARIESIPTSKLQDVLEEGYVPVVAGFQGVDEGNEITTIGRGGSDTSAVALAAVLNADECRIYTDVDGVYTADPNIVEHARKLTSVDFEEMLEMASLGAKVLHTRAVEFAHKYSVPLRVLSSFASDDGTKPGQGTLVTAEIDDMEKPIVSAVTHERDEAKLTVVGVSDVPGVAIKILGPIGDASILVDMIVQNDSVDGKTDFSFTVKRADYARAMEILQRTVHDEVSDISAKEILGDDTIAKVTIVGVGMRSHSGVATKMFETLAHENINIQMISTSEIKVSVVIAERYIELAVRTLHQAFELDHALEDRKV